MSMMVKWEQVIYMDKMNVVLFTDENQFPEHRDIMRGVSAAIEEYGHNLILVPVLLNANKESVSVDYVCQMIIQLERMGIDGYILPVDCLRHGDDYKEAYDFLLQHIDHHKLLCLGADLEDIPCVKRNYDGIFALLNHLLDDHKYRHFGILANTGSMAIEEDEAFCKRELEKRDASYIIKRCHINDDIKAMTKAMIEEDPKLDCIMAASDQFAMAIYDAINEEGLDVGKDIAVTGYGNLPISRLMDPALSTIGVDYYRLGYEAAVELVNIIQGAPRSFTTYPTTMIRRRSCEENFLLEDWRMLELTSKKELPVDEITEYIYTSCVVSDHEELYDLIHALVKVADDLLHDEHPKNGEKIIRKIMKKYAYCNYFSYTSFHEKLKNFYHYLTQAHSKKKLYREYIHYADQFTRIINKIDLLVDASRSQRQEDVFKIVALTAFHENDQEAAFQEMMKCVHSLGFGYASFYYLDEPFPIKDYTPHELFIKAEFIGDEIKNYDFEKREPESMLKPLDDGGHTCTMCALYAGYELLGFVLLECHEEQLEEACLTAESLGLATKYLNLLSVNKQRLNLIEQYNEALKHEADYDELTGLLNRRGFLRKMNELFHVYHGMHAYLYYIDLDRLKVINDTYGHNEGDFAINKVAEVLRNSFRVTDLVARFGGDEFAAFAIMPHREKEMNSIRIKQRFDDFNKLKCKDYRINASIGYVEFEITEELDLQALFDHADSALYVEKEKNHQKFG